jgi:hypothetical protein
MGSIGIWESIAQELIMSEVPEKTSETMNLIHFLGNSLRIANKKELDHFLESPEARHKVQSTPYQDIFMVIKTVGLADSLELLPLTLRNQRCGFIDLDCWRKDTFQATSFVEWMSAFVQAGPEEVVRTVRALDPDLVALLLKQNIQVHLIDPEEPLPDLPLTYTPDRRFGIEITGEGDSATISRLLLDAFFRHDPAYGYDLINWAHWDNTIHLEEEAYQNKRRRLEEIGFVDYYDAMEIYNDTGFQLPSPKSSLPPAGEKNPLSNTLPALFVTALKPGQFLWDALVHIDQPAEAERINQGLAALSNRILSVHSVSPGDLEKVTPALEEVRDTLSVALEYLSEERLSSAHAILLENDVQALFKTGFSRIATLRDRAERLARQGTLAIKGMNDWLLDPPDNEFFAGLKRLQPRLYEGIVDPHRSTYRNFRCMADLRLAEQRLDTIELLGKAFWQLFQESAHPLGSEEFHSINLPVNEIRFPQIFNSCLLTYQLKGNFGLELTEEKTVREILEKFRFFYGRPIELAQHFMEIAGSLVQERIVNPAQRQTLNEFSEKWIRSCAEELAPQLDNASLDGRFIRSFLLRI